MINQNQFSKDQSNLAELGRNQDELLKRLNALSLKANKFCQDAKLNDLVYNLSALKLDKNNSNNANTASAQPKLAAPRQKLKVDLNAIKNVNRASNKVNVSFIYLTKT